MDFSDGPDEASFRKEVAAFIDAEAPKPKPGESAIEAMAANWQANQAWFKKLGAKGWIAPAWPKEYGGASMTTMQQFVFNEEMALRKAPRPMHMIIGLGMAGPTIIVHGTRGRGKRRLRAPLPDPPGDHRKRRPHDYQRAPQRLTDRSTTAPIASDPTVFPQ